MTTITIQYTKPDPAIFSRMDNMIAGADQVVIESDAQLQDAGERLRSIKAVSQEFETQRKDTVKPLNDAVKTINALFKDPLNECAQAENHIKRAIADYQHAQEKKRREAEIELRRQQALEQERLRRDAAKIEAAAADKARKQAEKTAEQARKLEEQGKAEQARQKLEQAEIDRVANEMRAADQAEAMRQMADATPDAVVLPAAPKIEGVSTRHVWKFTVNDVKLLPAMYLLPDNKKIGKVVRALGGDTDIPGVQVYTDDVVSARA
ncbi:MAG: hypothetical protein OEQ39_05660 [Gammaproteobacteria bacterium]|nr:hypothetical protein [Gammaproteobacteria bacterium]